MAMTRKERILRLLERLPDDIGFTHMIHHLTVLRGVEIGVERTMSGAGIDNDDFFQCLLDADPFWPPLSEERQNNAPSANAGGASSKPGRHKKVATKG